MKKLISLVLVCLVAFSLYAQDNVGIGTNTPLAKMDIKGALALREGAALTLGNGGASGGTNDNISLPNITGTSDFASFYRITGPTAAFSIYGIAPESGVDGQVLILVNTSNKAMTIINNGSSVSVNGIITQTGGNITDNAGSSANSSITMQYNKTAGKWYVTATQNFTISAASITGTTVGNASSVNNLTTTVNGVTSTAVPIINSHTLTQNGSNQLTSTVNGVSAGPTTLDITGDVTGSLGAATVAGIEGKAITLTSLANNNILEYNSAGTDWVNVTPASILSANTTHTLSSSGNTITSTVNGVAANAPAVNTVSNTSSANTLSTIVNGVTSTAVPIINSHTLTQNGSNQLTSTVNGVSAGPTILDITGDVTGSLGAATVAGIEGKAITLTSLANNNILEYNSAGTDWVNVTPASILSANTTHTLSSSGNTITSTVNGVAANAPAVNTVSNTSSANTLSTTVNGVTSTAVPIINSHTLTQNGSNQLTSTVNGVSAGPTTLDITGDVTGSLGAATVAGIEGKAITLTSLANNNILEYNSAGTDWVNVTPASILSANTTHTLSSSGNTITSTVNGVAANAPAVNTVSNTNSANTLSTTVNGVTSTAVPIINTHILTQNGSNQLTSTVNGVSAGPTTLDITGDVTGSLGAATVAGIEGKAISITSLANGNILQYNGTNWVNEAPNASLISAWGLSGNATIPSNFIGTTNDYSFRIRTDNIERMVVDSLGNVGIGTTTPTTGMEVVDNYANKNVITVENTNSTGYSSVDFWDNSGALQGTFGYANTGVTNTILAGNTYFFSYGNDFAFGNNNNNYSLYIVGSNSNVGIGTNTPQSTMDVAGNLSVGSYGGANAAPTNGMIVSGTVGIGTKGPSDKLQINDGNVGISNDDNTAGSLKFYEPSSSGTNYQSFSSPALAANITYTLPTTAGSSGQFLSTNGTGTLSWASAGSSTLANPTGTIGLTAVNGTATTGMRSDAAPAIDQAIAPSWTGTHTFSNSTYSALFTGGNVGIGISTPADKLQVNDGSIRISNDNNTAGSLKFYEPSSSGTNYQSFSSPALAANITYTLPNTAGNSGQFLSTNGSGTLSWASGGSATFANPSGTIGLTAVNGTATTGMRSDAAPAIDQTIAPSWTGTHTFSNSTYSALFTGGNVGVGITNPTSSLTVDGSIGANTVIKTSTTYTPNASDFCIIFRGHTNTCTLPAASGCPGRIYSILNQGTGTLTISSINTNTTTLTSVATGGGNLLIISDGSAWNKIN